MIKNVFFVMVLVSSSAFAGSPVQQGDCKNGKCFKNVLDQGFNVVENTVVGTANVAVAVTQKVCPSNRQDYNAQSCGTQVYYRRGLFRRR